MKKSNEQMIETSVCLKVHEDYSQSMHDSLQNQMAREELQKMESDMIKSLEKRFEDTGLNLDDLMSSTVSSLSQIISMT